MAGRRYQREVDIWGLGSVEVRVNCSFEKIDVFVFLGGIFRAPALISGNAARAVIWRPSCRPYLK